MVCKRRRKRLYTFVMAINSAIWIFFLCVSWSCCQETTRQYVLDYNIVDTDLSGSQLVDETVYQRDILEDADAHFALYHKDDSHRVRRPLLSEGQGNQPFQQRSNENSLISNSDNAQLSDRQPTSLPFGRVGESQKPVIALKSDTLSSRNSKNQLNNIVKNVRPTSNTSPQYVDKLDGRKDRVNLVDILSLNPLGDAEGMGNKDRSHRVGSVADEDQAEGGERRRIPQAVIIGVKKAGTRALLEYLKMHPDVKAPGPEPHFFDKNYDKGYQWYRDQMPASFPGQLTIEKTPSYFITREVPSRMFSMSPNLRLIVVIRDPVTRAISDYAQGLDRRPDLKPFEQMAFLDNSTEIVNTSWGGIKIGLYVSHLEKWLKYFRMEQIHFVDGERLIREPAEEMYTIQKFLNIRPFINETHFSLDSGKGFPCMKKPWGQGHVHCLDKTKGRAHPTIDTKAIQRLREFYKPFNEKLTEMLGRNFGW